MLPQRWLYIPVIARAWRYVVALLGAVGLAALYQASGRNVEVVVDGRPLVLHTHARTSGAVLRELGIFPGEQDALSPSASIALVGSAATVELRTAHPVLVQAPSSSVWQASPDRRVENILDAAGVSLYPGDTVLVDGLSPRQLAARPWDAPRLIQLQNGHPIELRIDGVSSTIFSSAPTLAEALWENGLTLYEGDAIRPAPESRLSGPLQAEITRSRPLQIALAGGELSTRSAAVTVGQALAETGIALLGLDYSLPDSNQPLPSNGRVRVVRVLEVIQVEQEPLPFTTTYQPVDTLEIDQRSVVQAGAYGVSARRIRVRLEDGGEVARVVEGEWIAQQPQDQITGYGTQIQVRSVATDDGGLEYWRAVQMYATSYSASRAGVSLDSPSFGITASGKPLTKGLVAIDRSLIPFGTRMYVSGYGFAEAADTGGGVKGRWIDLGYDDDNYVPWSRYVTVYFLTPVPSPDSIVWIFP
jgi:uncharacterized protein YabE (DUF348 family)